MNAVSPQQRRPSEKLGLLREIDLFKGLSDDDIAVIGQAATLTQCIRGQRILSPGDPAERIHILVRGRIRTYRVTPDGQHLTLDIHAKGAVLGSASLFGEEPIPQAFAEALDEVIFCTIPADEMRSLIERYPAVGGNTITYLSGRLDSVDGVLKSMLDE